MPAWLLACLPLLALPTARAADDWGQEGQDAGAGSNNGDQAMLNAGNLGQVVKLWSRDLDVWAQSTGVVMAGGQAFVGRKISDPKTTVQQQLARLDPDTGAIVWKANLPEAITTPALTPTLVIAAGNGIGDPGAVTRVRAFDRATGARRWLYRHPRPVMFRAPHVLDGVAYLVSLDGDTVALDAETGALRWRHMQHGNCCGTQGLAVADGVMVVSRTAGLVAFATTDGHRIWHYDLPQFHIANERPMIVNGTALLFDLDGRVHAFDLHTGAVKWVAGTQQLKLSRSSGPLATDGQRVFALNGVVRPWVNAIDLATGTLVWTSHERVWTHSPIVSNGVLYLGTAKHLLALDPATGAALSMAPLPSTRNGDLSIAEGRLLMSGGPVHAYGLPPAQ
jgi:outer membrane protein assembly factor BamB